jgi:dihydroflavonol-4-reductase
VNTLITGATGLIGSVLTRRLLAEGEEVRIFRRPTSNLDLLGQAKFQVEHAFGDITDPEAVARAMDGVRFVYHTAGFIGMDGRRDRERLHEVNVAGTAHVVNAALAAGVERLVHTSSIAALGRPQDPAEPVDETMEFSTHPAPSSYAKSKYAGELEVHRGIAEGLDAVIVNPSLVFGLTHPGENTRAIIEKVRDGRLPAIPPGSTSVVDVEDVVTGHLHALHRGETGERYILGGENLSWRAIIGHLADALGVQPPRWVVPAGLLRAAAVAVEGVSLITGLALPLTREMARTAGNTYRYSNAKAVEKLGSSFRPFRQTAERLAQALAAEDGVRT